MVNISQDMVKSSHLKLYIPDILDQNDVRSSTLEIVSK